MFTLSKIAWMFVEPCNVLGLLTASAVVLFLVGKLQIAWRLGVAAVLLQMLLLNLPLANLVLGALEHRFPTPALPARVDGVLVLGGAIDVDAPEESIRYDAERLRAMGALSRMYPHARIVFAGGNGRLGKHPSESAIVKPLLDEIGMDASRVTFETRSRNTFENAVFTRELIKPAPDETWILVTSALHMSRAVGTFRRQGWNVLPYPLGRVSDGTQSEDGPWFTPGASLLWSISAREALGLLVYRVTGRSSELRPAP